MSIGFCKSKSFTFTLSLYKLDFYFEWHPHLVRGFVTEP